MTKRPLLKRRERLAAIIPAVAFAAAQAAQAQTDLQTSVVRLGVPTASRTAMPSRGQVSQQALISIQRDLHQASVRQAAAAMNWDEVLSATGDMADVCQSGLDLWARGSALYALERGKALEAFYSSVLAECDRQDILALALEHSAYQLDVTGRFQVHANSMSLDLEGEASTARDALLRAAIDARITDHIERHEWADAIRVASETSDRDRLLQVGWAIIDQDTELARDAFADAMTAAATDTDEESRYGHALASFRLGEFGPALDYAPSNDADPASFAARGADLAALSFLENGDRRRKNGDWTGALDAADRVRSYGKAHQDAADSLTARTYLAAAQASYDAGDYAEAKERALTAAMYPETGRGGAMRAAWSDLQLGDNKNAANAFRRLYTEAPDSESADGLVLASANLGELDALGPLARITGGPLGGAVRGRQSDDAFNRDDFQTAYDLAPERHEELEGINSPWARQSVAMRSARGQPGEGRVRGVLTRTSIGFGSGRSRFEVGVAGASLSSGQAPDAAAVGTPGLPNSDLDVDALSPFLSFEREGLTHVSATLSSTPIGGAVTARPTGSLSLERRGRGMTLNGRLHSTPIDETVTSFTGRTDPASGVTWGAAVKSGAEAIVRYNLRTDLIVTGSASAAVVSGKNIRSNPTYSIEGGLSKSFDVDGLKYLAVGPFYQFQAYERNTNFHTLGHGGYFSPQAFNRAGVGVNMQTDETRQWIARVDAAAAYEHARTDAAPILPQTAPDGAQFSGGTTSGLALSTKIGIGRRLTENWIISAGANAIASEAYDDVRGGFSLRYTFGKRKAVVNRDLQPDFSNRDIW